MHFLFILLFFATNVLADTKQNFHDFVLATLPIQKAKKLATIVPANAENEALLRQLIAKGITDIEVLGPISKVAEPVELEYLTKRYQDQILPELAVTIFNHDLNEFQKKAVRKLMQASINQIKNFSLALQIDTQKKLAFLEKIADRFLSVSWSSVDTTIIWINALKCATVHEGDKTGPQYWLLQHAEKGPHIDDMHVYFEAMYFFDTRTQHETLEKYFETLKLPFNDYAETALRSYFSWDVSQHGSMSTASNSPEPKLFSAIDSELKLNRFLLEIAAEKRKKATLVAPEVSWALRNAALVTSVYSLRAYEILSIYGISKAHLISLEITNKQQLETLEYLVENAPFFVSFTSAHTGNKSHVDGLFEQNPVFSDSANWKNLFNLPKIFYEILARPKKIKPYVPSATAWRASLRYFFHAGIKAIGAPRYSSDVLNSLSGPLFEACLNKIKTPIQVAAFRRLFYAFEDTQQDILFLNAINNLEQFTTEFQRMALVAIADYKRDRKIYGSVPSLLMSPLAITTVAAAVKNEYALKALQLLIDKDICDETTLLEVAKNTESKKAYKAIKALTQANVLEAARLIEASKIRESDNTFKFRNAKSQQEALKIFVQRPIYKKGAGMEEQILSYLNLEGLGDSELAVLYNELANAALDSALVRYELVTMALPVQQSWLKTGWNKIKSAVSSHDQMLVARASEVLQLIYLKPTALQEKLAHDRENLSLLSVVKRQESATYRENVDVLYPVEEHGETLALLEKLAAEENKLATEIIDLQSTLKDCARFLREVEEASN